MLSIVEEEETIFEDEKTHNIRVTKGLNKRLLKVAAKNFDKPSKDRGHKQNSGTFIKKSSIFNLSAEKSPSKLPNLKISKKGEISRPVKNSEARPSLRRTKKILPIGIQRISLKDKERMLSPQPSAKFFSKRHRPSRG